MVLVEHTEVCCVDIVKHPPCWVEGESGASWQIQHYSHTPLPNSLEDAPGVLLESRQTGLTLRTCQPQSCLWVVGV